jgi:uncharacterized iron-regulated protein
MHGLNSETGGGAAYRLYDSKGRQIAYDKTIDRLAEAQVVLFGELHDNVLIHRMQWSMTEDLFEKRKGKMILGAEMFDSDNQLILDEYLAGLILHRHLVAEAKVWDNYEEDYSALVDFAKEHRLKFIATNIPRRYAGLVSREGIKALDRVSGEAKQYIAPLPIGVDLATPGYREMMEMNLDMGHGMQMDPANLVAAQAVKDATMAYFIIKNRTATQLFLHFNGVYHSRNFGGIYWYLKQAAPGLTILTLSSVEGKHLEFQDEYKGLGDFILVVPSERKQEEEE